MEPIKADSWDRVHRVRGILCISNLVVTDRDHRPAGRKQRGEGGEPGARSRGQAVPGAHFAGPRIVTVTGLRLAAALTSRWSF